MNNLYYDNDEGIYLFNDLFKKCDVCTFLISEVIFITCFWNKRKSNIVYTCTKCKNSLTNIYSVKQQFVALITLNIPDNSTPVVISKPLLSNTTNMSTFDVANTILDKEQVIDNTVYANRQDIDLENATIGQPDIVKKLEVKDNKLLSVDEGLNLLDTIAKAKPLIEQDEQDKYLLR